MLSNRKYTYREMMRNFFSVVAGVLTTILIIMIFGYGRLSFHLGLSGKHRDPIRYAMEIESYWNAHAWGEVATFIAGFFIGGLVTALISTRNNLSHALMVPPIILILFYPSLITNDVAFLALPLWMFMALLAWKLSEWIKYKRGKKAIV